MRSVLSIQRCKLSPFCPIGHLRAPRGETRNPADSGLSIAPNERPSAKVGPR